MTHDTMDAPLDSVLIIIHREYEGFQDPAFAESVWKMVQHGRNSWEPIRMAVLRKPHPSPSPQHQA